MKKRGFTLIELVVVLIIISFLAMVGFVIFTSYRFQVLQAATERVAADLRYAKNMALTTATWHGVEFFPDPANSYFIYSTDGSTDRAIKDPSDPGKNYSVNFSGNYSGVVINSVNISGGNKIEFDPLGVPYNDKNGQKLTITATITLMHQNEVAYVKIDPETGRIYTQ